MYNSFILCSVFVNYLLPVTLSKDNWQNISVMAVKGDDSKVDSNNDSCEDSGWRIVNELAVYSDRQVFRK